MNLQESFLVRPATREDWSSLWPLLVAMGQIDGEVDVNRRYTAMVSSEKHALLVASLANGLVTVGYAWAQDYGPHLRSDTRIARLHDLYVDPHYRRRGAGSLLLAAVERWAREQGVTWLQWQASAAALPFYARLGLVGDPCPDPNHPFFEIDLSRPRQSAKGEGCSCASEQSG